MRAAASRLAWPPNLSNSWSRSGDPTLTVALPFTAMAAKHETGEMVELLLLAQLVIDLADGDLTKGSLIVGSPLTCAIGYRGVARCSLGIAGWEEDLTGRRDGERI